MYLEQESRFDSTKDVSEFGGHHATSSFVKDYQSAPSDPFKLKGQGASYDEAWQVDQSSS